MADPEEARQYLGQFLANAGLELAPLSKRLGKNHAYLQQYIKPGGTPLHLKEDVREALVRLVPGLDGERLKPPPVDLKPPGRHRGNKAKIDAPRRRKIVDDPSTLELLDAWGDIRDPKDREMAIRILRSMGNSGGASVVA